VAVLVAGLVATVATGIFLLGTPAGARWLAAQVAGWSHGAVRLAGVSGTVAGVLEAEELTIEAGTARIRAERVALDARLDLLLARRIGIASLRAARVEVVMPAGGEDAAAPAQPFRMPAISTPWPVDLRVLEIAALTVRVGERVTELSRLRLAADLDGARLTVRQLSGAAGGLGLRLAGTAELTPRLPLDLRLEWRFAEPALSGAGTVRGNLDTLDIEQFLRVPEAVRVAATLMDPAGEAQASAVAEWAGIALEIPGIGAARAADGRATFDGTAQAWSATLAADLSGAGLPALRARGSAHGTPERIAFDEIAVAGAAGALAATGALELVPARRLRLDVEAREVDTAALRPGLEGRVSGSARVDAELPGEVRVVVADLGGRLMGRPLAGSGALTFREGNIGFDEVSLRAGGNRLQADGSLGARLAGRFRLDAPELAVLWPGLSGRLVARATVSGTLARPVVDLDARGSALALGDDRLRDLELRLQVDRSQSATARLAARGLDAGGRQLGDLELGLDGTVGAHRLEARLAGGALAARLTSAGRWDGRALRERLSEASLAADMAGAWQLSGTPELVLSADAAVLEAHCWQQPPTSLCLGALAWSPGRWTLSAALRELDLERFNRWLPEDLALAGMAEADVSLDFGPAGPTGAASWRQDGATLYYTGGEEPLVTPLESVRLALEFAPAGATGTLAVRGADGVELAGAARMASPLGTAAALDAEITGRLPDIAPLVPLFAGDLDLAEVVGKVVLDAAVGGSLGAPEITGVLRLAEGAVALPDLGVKLEAIDISLLGDGSSVLRLQGAARAGGPLTLSGELRPLEEGGPAGYVRIRGNKVDAVRLPDRFVQASPDVTLRQEGGALAVSGSVGIPKADIVVRELPESTASPSPDTVVLDRPAEVQDTGVSSVAGEVAVTLGRDVRLRGFGLDTRLEGTVTFSRDAGGAPQGFGVVRLADGKLGAYGKELTIERGTLGFSGPVDDPLVDLRASRQVDWEGRRVTAGILVSGPASRPQTRVFSDPAMAEADALSYLISGQPMRSASSGERPAIAGAALALGVQQTSPFTEQIGDAVLLDELGVQGGTFDETEVVAGKQLGSDLYVRFTYGLFSRIGTVLARYRIGRNLSIEAASGEDQSLDLVYSVEKE
jgi:translocation and assembly module TamB